MEAARTAEREVAAVIDRLMAGAPDAQAKTEVAIMGAASAVGTAAGAFYALHEAKFAAVDEREFAQALWDILAPMVSRSISAVRLSRAAVEGNA
jgi:hypothetical protein